MGSALTLHPKVVGATGGGTLGVLCVWLLGLAHVGVDPIVASALATSVAGFCGWLAPIIQRETGGSGGAG